ncbi:MAG: aldehyde ferredoxin oxidoreductase N-terminal domain-containing protein [Anaerolineae bacterium]
MYGWIGTILEVDLTDGRISRRETAPYTRGYVGGRGLAARLAWEGLPKDTGPFDPENVVIIATGPLTGTLSPTAGRTVMTSLSPRTYPYAWHTHSTLGGWFGPALKYAGYDALIIRGRAAQPVYIDIQDGQVRLVDAGDLWGQGARTTQLALRERYGSGTQVLAIGPAGENCVRFASVQHAEENAAAHSGFGAVWGAKNLKAVAVRGSGGVPVARPAEMLAEIQASGKYQVTPSPASLQPRATLVEWQPVCSQACTFNCRVNRYYRTEDGRIAPAVCIGPVWAHGGMGDTLYEGGGVRVPAAANFAERETRLHQLCNDLGLDLWFRLVMQPWFVRCRELGVTAIRGYPIEPTDGAWFENLMHEIAYRRGLGALFGDDLRRAMDELKHELPDELIQLGHELEFDFGFPAHREGRFWDEEPLPFWVVSAMMHCSESRDPTIGSHESSLLLAEWVLHDPEIGRRHLSQAAERVLGDATLFEAGYEGKAPLAIWSQNQHLLVDMLPMCDFAFPQLTKRISSEQEWRQATDVVGDVGLGLRLLRAVTGEDWSEEELERAAERALNVERVLLARAGRGRPLEETLLPHFKLPCRADGTTIDEAGFSRLLDEYYAARDWDLQLGWPTEAKLLALGLADVATELADLRKERE